MTNLVAKLRAIAKAIVAAVTPIVVAGVADIAAELSTMAQGAITAVASAVLVYLVRNAPQPTPEA